MGRTVSAEDKLEKRSDSADLEDEQQEEEEEEALSLCDFPLHLNKEQTKSTEAETEEIETRQEDFYFELWRGSLSSTSEMCSADDIFFKGQILPFRNSASSENGLSNFKEQNSNPKGGCLSRSESIGGFTSSSSRSSSSRSQFSSSSSAGSSRISRPIIQNQFFAHSSPKPQIRIPNSSIGNGSASSNRNRKSTVWEFFRLGLVHNPEIELKDLKIRYSVSRNSSTSSSSNRGSKRQSSSKNMDKQSKQSKQSLIEKRLLLGGCNCTVNSVKPDPFAKLKIEKNEGKKKKQELKKKKNQKRKMVKRKAEEKEGEKEEKLNNRTVDWIKELSNSSFVVEEEEEGHSLGS